MFRIAQLVIGIFVCVFLIHGFAVAQSVAIAELPAYVKTGDAVSITGVDGSRLEGRVAALTDRSLTLLVNDSATGDIRLADVGQIVIRDSRKNGALIGLAAGAVPGTALGFFMSKYCANEGGSGCSNGPVVIGAIFGGVGAAIGGAIDGLIRRTIRVNPRQGVRVNVSPIVRTDRRGMSVSIRF